MTTHSNLNRLSYSAFVWAASALILLCAPATAQDAYEVVPVQRQVGDRKSSDINAQSEFKASEQVANQYLAITVTVTKTTVTPVKAELVRGPKLANSASSDLWVRALENSRLVSEYRIRDPRFSKKEGGAWVEAASAETIVLVPLSSTINQLEIVPATGRGAIVSGGGDFDPRPWATLACDGHNPDLYPNCPDILALGIPPP